MRNVGYLHGSPEALALPYAFCSASPIKLTGVRVQATTNTSAERTRQAIARLTELPAGLRVVLQALEATEDPLYTNEQLQEILSQDPGATADLLRLANSPFFGVSNLVRTLAMAVTVVGRLRLITLLRHLIPAIFLREYVRTQQIPGRGRGADVPYQPAAG